MRTGDNVRKRSDGRYEARFHKGRDDSGNIIYGFCYGKTREEAVMKRDLAIGEQSVPKDGVRRMNLLILGAGGQGQVLKDIAMSLGVVEKIAFLYDDISKKDLVGKPLDCARFIGKFPIAIPSVGNPVLRKSWIKMLATAGFIVPTIISPSAMVSRGAKIGYGTLIEPKAIIGANVNIGHGCIICSGAIIERDATLDSYTLIGYGQTVGK